MPEQRLLWIASETSLEVFGDWSENLSEFAVKQYTDLTQACLAITAKEANCVLVTGALVGFMLVDQPHYS